MNELLHPDNDGRSDVRVMGSSDVHILSLCAIACSCCNKSYRAACMRCR
jgi:hypothetical protein